MGGLTLETAHVPKYVIFDTKVLVLSKLGYLTLDYIENYPKKYHLPKKLAFTKVCYLECNKQVTLLLQYILTHFLLIFY